MKSILLLFVLFSTLLFSTAQKYTTHKCKAHTWNDIVSGSGVWSGQLTPIYEKSYFVTPNCKEFNHFTTTNMTFGFIYGDNANFNLAYTLTLVSNNPSPAMASKSCIFVITAFKPADPDIKILSYHNATCSYKFKEDGAIYYVK